MQPGNPSRIEKIPTLPTWVGETDHPALGMQKAKGGRTIPVWMFWIHWGLRPTCIPGGPKLRSRLCCWKIIGIQRQCTVGLLLVEKIQRLQTKMAIFPPIDSSKNAITLPDGQRQATHVGLRRHWSYRHGCWATGNSYKWWLASQGGTSMIEHVILNPKSRALDGRMYFECISMQRRFGTSLSLEQAVHCDITAWCLRCTHVLQRHKCFLPWDSFDALE